MKGEAPVTKPALIQEQAKHCTKFSQVYRGDERAGVYQVAGFFLSLVNHVEAQNPNTTQAPTTTTASERWWKQLSFYGANPRMMFTYQMRIEKTRIIRNWGKIIVTTPMKLLKIRLQDQQGHSAVGLTIWFTRTYVAEAFVSIRRAEGPRALFKGAVCRVMFIAPPFAIAQTVYNIGVTEKLLGQKKAAHV
ncbi:hypothetical protein ANCCEY_12385 [Ancylostoma ceylanicum]|uniref:Uncharacterized protein n=1 Tax=Ancylostoma ceylanicum TaxID=53326 RepID=A0A0D6L9C8_9BILA|nr:hypothetical protein ANCCEY_12385 [Ancylostoma ceylanicum]